MGTSYLYIKMEENLGISYLIFQFLEKVILLIYAT